MVGPHSLMDRMRACGACDVGSIPTGDTNKFALVVQWIARELPKFVVQVRILSRAQHICSFHVFIREFIMITRKLKPCIFGKNHVWLFLDDWRIKNDKIQVLYICPRCKKKRWRVVDQDQFRYIQQKLHEIC